MYVYVWERGRKMEEEGDKDVEERKCDRNIEEEKNREIKKPERN